MRTADIQPFDVVYAVGSPARFTRGVVLSHKVHSYAQRPKPGRMDAYEREVVGMYPNDRPAPGSLHGLPVVLTEAPFEQVPDETLRALGREVWAELQRHRLPELPEGFHLTLRRARDIVGPYEASEKQRRDQEAREARKAATAEARRQAEREAKTRVREMLGKPHQLLPTDWQELAALLDRQRQRILAERAALLRSAADGRHEYQRNCPAGSGLDTLQVEEGVLRHAADVVEGDLRPMYAWLPSASWTPEMHEALAVKPVGRLTVPPAWRKS